VNVLLIFNGEMGFVSSTPLRTMWCSADLSISFVHNGDFRLMDAKFQHAVSSQQKEEFASCGVKCTRVLNRNNGYLLNNLLWRGDPVSQ
jgi:hypothetical protein